MNPVKRFSEIYMAALLLCLVTAIGLSCSSPDPQAFAQVSFETADGGKVNANLYGNGDHAVVLAHGKIFNKESWHNLARHLASKGFQALAIDFRQPYGRSMPGTEKDALHEDVLAAIRYLKNRGAEKVSVIGASMGGEAAIEAAINAQVGDIDKLILISPMPHENINRMFAGSILFIASEEEAIVDTVREQYENAPEPKRLELLEGDGHAQHIFKTEQAQKLTDLIVAFLSE
jgi:esterase/lipase